MDYEKCVFCGGKIKPSSEHFIHIYKCSLMYIHYYCMFGYLQNLKKAKIEIEKAEQNAHFKE